MRKVWDGMYEYKVEIYKIKKAEDEMNAMAKHGWRVVAVTHCPFATRGEEVVVTFERNKKDTPDY